MYSRVVKQEQGETGARVSLAPGIVDTDMQVAIRSSDPAHFPALSKFQEFHATGKLSSPANVATRILAYLDRDDFGTLKSTTSAITTDPHHDRPHDRSGHRPG